MNGGSFFAFDKKYFIFPLTNRQNCIIVLLY